MNDTQRREADEEASFAEAANVADPVEDVVDLTVDLLQVEVHLDRHCEHDAVLVVPRAPVDLIDAEDSLVVLRECADAEARILQLQVRQLHLVHVVLTDLRVERDVPRAGLLDDFALAVLLDPEPTAVVVEDEILATQPPVDLLVALAPAWVALLRSLLLVAQF